MKAQTKLVRILIAITDDGTYRAHGASDASKQSLELEMSETLHHVMTPPIEFHWIFVRVPMPAKSEPIFVKGASRQKRRPVMTRKKQGAAKP